MVAEPGLAAGFNPQEQDESLPDASGQLCLSGRLQLFGQSHYNMAQAGPDPMVEA